MATITEHVYTHITVAIFCIGIKDKKWLENPLNINFCLLNVVKYREEVALGHKYCRIP